MRITFRLIVSLIVGVTLVAFVFSYLQVRQEERRLREETERRAAVLAESLQESVEPLLDTRSSKNLQRIVERFGNRERLSGVAVYDANGRSLAITPGLPSSFTRSPAAAFEAVRTDQGYGQFQTINEKPMHIYALPPHREGILGGVLVILHDASHIEGFGLTVTEALWKKKPVVANAVGGMPLQVIHKLTGVWARSVEGTAYQVRFLLSNPSIAERLGGNGHEHVRENFLITSNLKRCLLLFLTLSGAA